MSVPLVLVVGSCGAKTGLEPCPIGAPGTTCEATLLVEEIVPNRATCWIDAPPVGATMVLEFPCANGLTRGMLGEIEFSGTASMCYIELIAQPEFIWDDDCSWETEQRISGDPRRGYLEYEYIEWPGQDEGLCAEPCWATGRVSLELESWR